jgi:Fe-S-cluster-containing dehydrogenase component
MAARPESRFAMAVDTRACVGCSACVIACKSENEVPDGHARRWVNQEVRGRFPDLKMKVWSDCCQHCEDAPCVTNCPTGASHYDLRTGTVQVTEDDCTGCKACMASCPYDARYVHPTGYIDKCTLCSHRLVEGRTTACAEICPTSAITVSDLDDPNSALSHLLRSRQSRQQKPAAGTRPKFFLLD